MRKQKTCPILFANSPVFLLNLSLNSHTWRSANPFAAGCARAVRALKYIYIYLVYVCNDLFHLTLVEQGRVTKTVGRRAWEVKLITESCNAYSLKVDSL